MGKQILLGGLIAIFSVVIIGALVVIGLLGVETSAESQKTSYVTSVTNPYFPLVPGTRYTYISDDGADIEEVYVTDKRKIVDGVSTVVVWDREWEDGELVEETFDWFAQDTLGNVWYFGEDSREISNGKIVSREGSWEAGVAGGRAGIVFLGTPVIGKEYYQEYSPNEAEDKGMVLATDVEITVGNRKYTNCIQTKDWNPLEENSLEHKYFCPGIGLVYEKDVEDGDGVHLKSVAVNTQPTSGPTKTATQSAPKKTEPKPEIQRDITQDEAIEIALSRIDGRVTDVELERERGTMVYAVEMRHDGEEKDVLVEVSTGNIIGVET